jgi:Uma2 family endonuclease
MDPALRWTSADLEVMPDNGKRYEVIDGELLVSRSPTYHHQFACVRIIRYLDVWSEETGLGEVNTGTGIIFADDDDVIPDVAWTSRARLNQVIGADGHFHAVPDLVVEVLSPGSANERRDRETKLKLYSRRGALEYWIVNWITNEITVFRRKGKKLRQVETLRAADTLTSPLLPGFSCLVKSIFDSYASAGKNPPPQDYK